jgi:uncharacterized membrane protein YhaH (DUF805 family)
VINLLFSFQGRINRAKFWLVHVGIVVVEAIVLSLMGGTAAIISGDYEQVMIVSGGVTGAVWSIVGVLAFWISLAAGVKRWHDRNKSGWWMLIILVPVIGSLWYLIECGFLKGTTGPNTYGPDPLAAG